MRDYLKGPELVAWLEQYFPESVRAIRTCGGSAGHYDDPEAANFARRMTDWEKAGGLASFYTVDRLFIKMGLHTSMLPEELWSDETPWSKRGGCHSHSAEIRRQAVEMPGSNADVARQLGVSSRSVQEWRKKARKAAA